MLDILASHHRNLFKTNLGVMLAIFAGSIWLFHRFYTHQEVDIPNVVSLIGFVLLFSLERNHGREMKAIHLKLDELLAAQSGASNRLIRAEESSEEILELAHEALHMVASNADSHAAISIEHTNFFDQHKLSGSEELKAA